MGSYLTGIIAKGHYSERATAKLTGVIVGVVQQCHQLGVMHRDLKPENFLLADKSENAPLKATDFGLSIFFKARWVLGKKGYERCVCERVGDISGCNKKAAQRTATSSLRFVGEASREILYARASGLAGFRAFVVATESASCITRTSKRLDVSCQPRVCM